MSLEPFLSYLFVNAVNLVSFFWLGGQFLGLFFAVQVVGTSPGLTSSGPVWVLFLFQSGIENPIAGSGTSPLIVHFRI